MSLVSHKKSYLVCVKLTNFRIFTPPIPNFSLFIYFQAAVSGLLAVSVMYVEKNQNKYYIIIWKFEISSHVK